MTEVINLRSYATAAASELLVIIDLQRYYYDKLCAEHGMVVDRSLENCRLAIQHARSVGIPLAYTRLSCETSSSWIQGLEPRRSDMVFDRNSPSCYASPYFEEIVSGVQRFAMAGLMAETACVATAIDAAHHRHAVTFLDDASISSGRGVVDGSKAHRMTIDLLNVFAQPITTSQWITATSHRSMQGRGHGR